MRITVGTQASFKTPREATFNWSSSSSTTADGTKIATAYVKEDVEEKKKHEQLTLHERGIIAIYEKKLEDQKKGLFDYLSHSITPTMFAQFCDWYPTTPHSPFPGVILATGSPRYCIRLGNIVDKLTKGRFLRGDHMSTLGTMVAARDLELNGAKKSGRGVVATDIVSLNRDRQTVTRKVFCIFYDVNDVYWILPIVIEYLERMKREGTYAEALGFLSCRNHDHPNVPEPLMKTYREGV